MSDRSTSVAFAVPAGVRAAMLFTGHAHGLPPSIPLGIGAFGGCLWRDAILNSSPIADTAGIGISRVADNLHVAGGVRLDWNRPEQSVAGAADIANGSAPRLASPMG